MPTYFITMFFVVIIAFLFLSLYILLLLNSKSLLIFCFQYQNRHDYKLIYEEKNKWERGVRSKTSK